MSNEDGINAGIFAASIPVTRRVLKRVEDDAEQGRKLNETKGAAFSASSLWNVCGSHIGNSRISTLQAQKAQLAIDAAKAAAQLRNKTDRQQKLLANAQRALV